LSVDPSWLMACIAFESAQTFRANIRNASGSGAVGLIQFMPQTARLLGTSTDLLAAMTPEGQLDYVEKYFLPDKGKLHDFGDVYMAILWPAAIGKSDDTVLFDSSDPLHPKYYLENKGLDFNHDGKITKAEAYAHPLFLMQRGLLAGNVTVRFEP
jgi:Transglycosylase SLT domain